MSRPLNRKARKYLLELCDAPVNMEVPEHWRFFAAWSASVAQLPTARRRRARRRERFFVGAADRVGPAVARVFGLDVVATFIPELARKLVASHRKHDRRSGRELDRWRRAR